jgi:hypothetical protein
VSIARTGLAGAICRCTQPPPAECGDGAVAQSLAQHFARPCRTLEKLGRATGKEARKLGRRAKGQLRRAASVAARLGKSDPSRACADAWRARFLEARERLVTR